MPSQRIEAPKTPTGDGRTNNSATESSGDTYAGLSHAQLAILRMQVTQGHAAVRRKLAGASGILAHSVQRDTATTSAPLRFFHPR